MWPWYLRPLLEQLRAACVGTGGVWIALLTGAGHPAQRGLMLKVAGRRADWRLHHLRHLWGGRLVLHRGLWSGGRRIAYIGRLSCQSTRSGLWGLAACECILVVF